MSDEEFAEWLLRETESSPTPMQMKLLVLAAEGYTDAQIGTRTFYSVKTIKMHMHLMRARIGAKNRTEAVHIGHQKGWLV
jgi:two-component system response regulator DesR